MKLNALLLSSMCLFAFSPALTSCGQPASKVVETVCAENDIAARCILENAKTTIATIDGAHDWITSATELSIALDSNGDTAQAWSYLDEAVSKLNEIEDIKKRDGAAADIALALKSLKKDAAALPVLSSLSAYAKGTENNVDILCKIVTARAIHESPEIARELALALSDEGDLANAYRGRTQREVAAIFAKKGDFKSAISMLDDITAHFTYYKAIAHTDIMYQAAKHGKRETVESLLIDAETIANEQENTYFTAGILRDIGHSFVTLGDVERGADYITKARSAAANAPKFQEKARSTSRIATRIADSGQSDLNVNVLNEALKLAEQEPSQMMKAYSLYEIAGSAAFANNVELSEELVSQLAEGPFLSATSLRAAGQRDLAWGLSRHGQVQAGVSLANAITAPREKVHALSRIVRLLNNPSMDALPRYL